jgi:hypothetical protein
LLIILTSVGRGRGRGLGFGNKAAFCLALFIFANGRTQDFILSLAAVLVFLIGRLLSGPPSAPAAAAAGPERAGVVSAAVAVATSGVETGEAVGGVCGNGFD